MQCHSHYQRTFDREILRGRFPPEIYRAAEGECGGETEEEQVPGNGATKV